MFVQKILFEVIGTPSSYQNVLMEDSASTCVFFVTPLLRWQDCSSANFFIFGVFVTVDGPKYRIDSNVTSEGDSAECRNKGSHVVPTSDFCF